jgi:enoyl-CoA hydratase
MATEFRYLEVRQEGAVVVCVMRNPPQNLLNAGMVEELHALVDGLAADEAARALVLTGGAEGIFITHYDVGELSRLSDVVRSRAADGGGAETAGVRSDAGGASGGAVAARAARRRPELEGDAEVAGGAAARAEARATSTSGGAGGTQAAGPRSEADARWAEQEDSADAIPADLHPLNRLSLKLARLPQAVIAAINGVAMGGGCELALACDFRLMARGGRLGLPEVRVGILPGAGGTQRMTRLLGQAKALELMLLGETVDADTAERLGLVHRAVDAGRVVEEAVALGREIASRPRLSVALIKQCVYRAAEVGLVEGLRFESAAFMQTMRSEDAARLMRAYLGSGRGLDEV